jgi:hypothetical protein
MLVTTSHRSRVFIGALLIAGLFLLLRLPGLHLPYHQDEWKNVASAETMEGAGRFFAHPPFMQMIFVAWHNIFGIEGFRLLPLLFSAGAGVLLYLVVAGRAGRHAALWAVGLFALCAYNIHGSLSPDVDGAILPFFFLLALYAHDKRWRTLFVSALLAGLLIKLSFILVIGVFILEYIWQSRASLTWKKSAQGVAIIAGFGAVYIALLYFIQAIYPAFSIDFMLGHAQDSAGGLGRNWTQVIVQGAKALFFLSPILIAPILFVSREVLKKSRPFFLYSITGLIFYFVLFDFSRAALDKYLLFLIVPLAAITGMIFAEIFDGKKISSYKPVVIAGVILGLILVGLNFLPHSIVPLYPKTEWFSKVLHGEWNILNPFIGGNGPMGFYVSFLFIALAYIASVILGFVGLIKKGWRTHILVILFIIGVAYNLVFAEEFLFGKINGHAPEALNAAISYIAENDMIAQVLTYSDTGAGPLTLMGKYAGRIYATPDAEENYRQKFKEFRGHYMVIDIPHLAESGFYGRFFAACDVLFETRSGRTSGKVYDCAKAKEIIDTI